MTLILRRIRLFYKESSWESGETGRLMENLGMTSVRDKERENIKTLLPQGQVEKRLEQLLSRQENNKSKTPSPGEKTMRKTRRELTNKKIYKQEKLTKKYLALLTPPCHTSNHLATPLQTLG
jgi:hypothetical protein